MPPYLFLRVVEREPTPAGEVCTDGMVVYHHRKRAVNGDVRVHQALKLIRIIVPLVPRDDESSLVRRGGAGRVRIVVNISSRSTNAQTQGRKCARRKT